MLILSWDLCIPLLAASKAWRLCMLLVGILNMSTWKLPPKLHQHVKCATRGVEPLVKALSNIKKGYRVIQLPQALTICRLTSAISWVLLVVECIYIYACPHLLYIWIVMNTCENRVAKYYTPVNLLSCAVYKNSFEMIFLRPKIFNLLW